MKARAVLFDPEPSTSDPEASTSHLDEMLSRRSKSWLAKHKARASIGDSNSPRLPRPDGSDSEGSSKVGTVKLMRTPLGLGLTVDGDNRVVEIAADSQAQRSGGFAVGQRLVSLRTRWGTRALGDGVSFDQLLSTVAVGTPVIVEVSMPADRV